MPQEPGHTHPLAPRARGNSLRVRLLGRGGGVRDRQWQSLKLGDKLGLLSFTKCVGGFWETDTQRQLFDELRKVRNALTHPGIFGLELRQEFTDLSAATPRRSTKTIHGKLKPPQGAVARFASTLGELGCDDARKAVDAYSGRNRPVIPEETGHPIRRETGH